MRLVGKRIERPRRRTMVGVGKRNFKNLTYAKRHIARLPTGGQRRSTGRISARRFG